MANNWPLGKTYGAIRQTRASLSGVVNSRSDHVALSETSARCLVIRVNKSVDYAEKRFDKGLAGDSEEQKPYALIAKRILSRIKQEGINVQNAVIVSEVAYRDYISQVQSALSDLAALDKIFVHNGPRR